MFWFLCVYVCEMRLNNYLLAIFRYIIRYFNYNHYFIYSFEFTSPIWNVDFSISLDPSTSSSIFNAPQLHSCFYLECSCLAIAVYPDSMIQDSKQVPVATQDFSPLSSSLVSFNHVPWPSELALEATENLLRTLRKSRPSPDRQMGMHMDELLSHIGLLSFRGDFIYN